MAVDGHPVSSACEGARSVRQTLQDQSAARTMKVMARGASASAFLAKGDQKGVGRMRHGARSTLFCGASTSSVLCVAQLPLWMSCSTRRRRL